MPLRKLEYRIRAGLSVNQARGSQKDFYFLASSSIASAAPWVRKAGAEAALPPSGCWQLAPALPTISRQDTQLHWPTFTLPVNVNRHLKPELQQWGPRVCVCHASLPISACQTQAEISLLKKLSSCRHRIKPPGLLTPVLSFQIQIGDFLLWASPPSKSLRSWCPCPLSLTTALNGAHTVTDLLPFCPALQHLLG